MSRTLKAFSLLLSYPTEALQQAIEPIRDALAAEGLLSANARRALGPLLDELAGADIYDVEERYVMLFDRSRSLSLNLFEHVHGESRDRGGAMVDLLEIYRAAGFDLGGAELPDHLPTVLEFLSQRPLAEARAMLTDAGRILQALKVRLDRRESAYAAIFDALLAIADARPDATVAEALAREVDEDPNDLAALDAVWQEAAVTFGPDPNAGCPAARDVLARIEATSGGAASPAISSATT